jgi:hypothetical protein
MPLGLPIAIKAIGGTALTFNGQHVEEARAALIEQYKRKPRMSALITAFVANVAILEHVFWQLLTQRRIDTAQGAQLDAIGRILTRPREGRDDPTYRRLLSVWGAVLRSKGTWDDLYAVARGINPASDPHISDRGFATVRVQMNGPLAEDDGATAAHFLDLAKAGGVQLRAVWSPVEGGIGFSNSSDAAFGGVFFSDSSLSPTEAGVLSTVN